MDMAEAAVVAAGEIATNAVVRVIGPVAVMPAGAVAAVEVGTKCTITIANVLPAGVLGCDLGSGGTNG